jgi:hypothetical protein
MKEVKTKVGSYTLYTYEEKSWKIIMIDTIPRNLWERITESPCIHLQNVAKTRKAKIHSTFSFKDRSINYCTRVLNLVALRNYAIKDCVISGSLRDFLLVQ